MANEPLDVQRLNRYDEHKNQYSLAIITDEDKASQVTLEDGQVAWRSTLRYDKLFRKWDHHKGHANYQIEPIPDEEGGIERLISIIAQGERGAEFSEMAIFGNKLLTFDDRTGLVCEIREKNQLIPRQILMTGSGDEKFKGFKSEWATLKGNSLFVGSHGRPEVENGKAVTGELEWVKVLNEYYDLRSVNWHSNYEKMRNALGIDSSKGYITHEAAEWHPFYQKWFFFPRKVSYEDFDESKDEREKGTNLLLMADEHFENIETMEIGALTPERGVSSFKFLPGHPDECVALKSVEVDDKTETYMFAFDLSGNILSDEIFLGHYKCEGIEIL